MSVDHWAHFRRSKKADTNVLPSDRLVGVGMVLEPDDPGNASCYVDSLTPGGPVEKSGRVSVGDRLIAVDRFNCVGCKRDVIRDHVMGR